MSNTPQHTGIFDTLLRTRCVGIQPLEQPSATHTFYTPPFATYFGMSLSSRLAATRAFFFFGMF